MTMTVPTTSPAAFIALEGADGAGKTTLARALLVHFGALGVQVQLTREPGASTAGALIREAVKHNPDLTDLQRLKLFTADRIMHMHQVVYPALSDGSTVICDRFVDSTRAYQGALGIPAEVIEDEIAASVGTFVPTLTVVLRLDAKTRLERMSVRRGRVDVFESRGAAFQARVQRTFVELAAAEPSRYLVLDARRPIEGLVEDVVEALHQRLRTGG